MTTLYSSLPAGARRHSLPATSRLLFALLDRMEYGSLALTTPDGVTRRFGPGAAANSLSRTVPAADLTLRDWRLCRDVITGGDIAFAEAYMDGRWHTGDLTTLLTVIAFNQRALERAFYGSWWRQLAFRLKHLLRSNSKRRARKNIVAHYDLGNDFYRLWLDPDDDVFGGAVRGRTPAVARAGAGREIRTYPARASAAGGRARSGNRLRLGRLCRNGSASRSSCHRSEPFRPRRPRTRVRASRMRGSPIASNFASRTTAMSADSSTASPPSKCSRRSANGIGRSIFRR